MHDVGSGQVMLVADALPNQIDALGVSPVPEIVVVVPPPGGPTEGPIDVIVGGPKLNWSERPAALCPAGLVTVTSTVPLPAGDTAVQVLGLVQDTPVAGVEPNITEESAVNPVPLMVTVVPPAADPAVGLIPVTPGDP